jgi:hypothetical protein
VTIEQVGQINQSHYREGIYKISENFGHLSERVCFSTAWLPEATESSTKPSSSLESHSSPAPFALSCLIMTDRIRRNGQLSACEPCRKSKLRCDHGRPVCGRCARRRLSEQQCHYHPAPMAKQLTPQSDQETPHQQKAAGSSPYELINMNKNLMSFADPNNPHSHRSYTSLTRTSIALLNLLHLINK